MTIIVMTFMKTIGISIKKADNNISNYLNNNENNVIK